MDFSTCTTYHGDEWPLLKFVEKHAYTFAKMKILTQMIGNCTDQEAEEQVLSLLTLNPADWVWDVLHELVTKCQAKEAERKTYEAMLSFRASARRNADTPGDLQLALERSSAEEVARRKAKEKAEEEATPTCPCTGLLVCVCV